MDTPCWNRLLAGAVAHDGATLEQSVPGDLYSMKRTHIRAVVEELQPVGRTRVAAVNEGLYPMRGTPHCSRGRPVEGRRGRDKWVWTDHNTPFHIPLCCSEWEYVEKLGMKLILGRREGWQKYVFSFVFISHYTTLLDLFGNKLISSGWICFTWDCNW